MNYCLRPAACCFDDMERKSYLKKAKLALEFVLVSIITTGTVLYARRPVCMTNKYVREYLRFGIIKRNSFQIMMVTCRHT